MSWIRQTLAECPKRPVDESLIDNFASVISQLRAADVVKLKDWLDEQRALLEALEWNKEDVQSNCWAQNRFDSVLAFSQVVNLEMSKRNHPNAAANDLYVEIQDKINEWKKL